MQIILSFLKGEWEILGSQAALDSLTNKDREMLKYFALRHILEK
jgi:hypothetical protein